MATHVNSICKRACCKIRSIGRIRSFLTDTEDASLVHAIVSSKIDYCNLFLYGLSIKHLNKLQRVLNCASQVMSCVRKHEHMSPVLKSLHWLPIPQRIEYKVIILTFKAVHGLAPEYLQVLLMWHKAARSLRSNDLALLDVPNTKLKHYGD